MSDDTFTYTVHGSDRVRESVISRELAEKLADIFNSKGLGPYSTEAGKWIKNEFGTTYVPGTEIWKLWPEVVELVEGLDILWKLDVSHIIDERRSAKLKLDRLESIKKIENKNIREWLVTQVDRRGFKYPEETDLSYLVKLARSKGGLNSYKPAYEPKSGCSAKMKLKEAIFYALEHNAYDDTTVFAVPVEIAEDSDLEVCRVNLSRFCQSLLTANGLAGYGSTWRYELMADKGFVILYQRSSIAD